MSVPTADDSHVGMVDEIYAFDSIEMEVVEGMDFASVVDEFFAFYDLNFIHGNEVSV